MPSPLLLGFRVGQWQVEPLRGAIRGPEGESQHLEPKVMDVFVRLAEQPFELITRDELLKAVWGERAVSDEPLTRTIAALRRALDDDRSAPSFIETIPKRGYRLIEHVELSDGSRYEPAAGLPGSADGPRAGVAVVPTWRRWLTAGGVTLIGLAIILSILRDSGLLSVMPRDPADQSSAIPERSIAVMPFTSCAADEDARMLALGIADEVIRHLAEIDYVTVSAGVVKFLTVTARTSSFAFKDSDFQPKRISRELGVRYLLDGDTCVEGDVLVTTARLIDNSGYLVWTEAFEQGQDAAGRVSNPMSQLLANAVAAELGGSAEQRTHDPVDRLALESLTIGRQYFAIGDRKRARAAFEKALLLEPEYADAKFSLALLELNTDAMAMGTSYDRATQQAEQALEWAMDQYQDDPRSFEMNFGIGVLIKSIADWERQTAWRGGTPPDKSGLDARYAEAEHYLRAATTINPSGTFAYEHLAAVIESQRRSAEALSLLEQVQARDPFNLGLAESIVLGWAQRGRFREAIQLAQRFEQLPEIPTRAWWLQVESMWRNSYWDEKCETLIRMLRHHPDAFASPNNRLHVLFFAGDLARLGLHDQAVAWKTRLDDMPMPDPYNEPYRILTERHYLEMTGRLQELYRQSRDRLATMTDEEILDTWRVISMRWLGDLAKTGEHERAIRLMERIRHAPGFYPERDTWATMLLADMYEKNGSEQDARALYVSAVVHLESQVAAGIRHPKTLRTLAGAYAALDRHEEAIQTLQLAVDFHERMPWWKPPFEIDFGSDADNPRVATLRTQVEIDLRGQASRVQAMLAGHDLDELLAPLMEMPDQQTAN